MSSFYSNKLINFMFTALNWKNKTVLKIERVKDNFFLVWWQKGIQK